MRDLKPCEVIINPDTQHVDVFQNDIDIVTIMDFLKTIEDTIDNKNFSEAFLQKNDTSHECKIIITGHLTIEIIRGRCTLADIRRGIRCALKLLVIILFQKAEQIVGKNEDKQNQYVNELLKMHRTSPNNTYKDN